VSVTLLLVGLIRAALWTTGACFAWTHRRVLAGVAFTLAAVNSSVFAFVTAGAKVPWPLFDVASALSVPIVATFVAALMLNVWHVDPADRFRRR
jgi:hypothetical protein